MTLQRIYVKKVREMRTRYRLVFVLFFMFVRTTFGDQTIKIPHKKETFHDNRREARAVFPLNQNNNEWKPVGRGDPLKDPTLDYMPPVLESVRYWAEGKTHSNMNDISLLGTTTKTLPNNKNREKFFSGAIKRTYYSSPYQRPFHSQSFHQQQPYRFSQQLKPPRQLQGNHQLPFSTGQQQNRKGLNVFKESPENSIGNLLLSRPTATKQNQTNEQFLPLAPPLQIFNELLSPTLSISSETTFNNSSSPLNQHTIEKSKLMHQSTSQEDTVSELTKTPSNVYQIHYTTTKAGENSSRTTSLSNSSEYSNNEKKDYTVPPWSLHKLITMEGHSKVKTYGLRNDDAESKFPKIKPVQMNSNPIVERVYSDNLDLVKRLQVNEKGSTINELWNSIDASLVNSLFSEMH